MYVLDLTNWKTTRRQMFRTATALLGSSAVDSHTRTVEAQENEPASHWSSIPVSNNWPAPRWDHSFAALGGDSGLLLFGGRDENFAPLGDSWLFDTMLEEWRQIDGTGPSTRFGHAVVSDPDSESVYLFGGQAGDLFHNDLWMFDSATEKWSQINDGTVAAPAPRYGTSLVLLPGDRLIVSHGFTFEGRYDDTWSFELNDNRWEAVTPEGQLPEKRCLHEAVWHADTEQMVLFGGCSSGYGPCPQSDFWALDPVSDHWAQILADPGPSARSNPALVADTEHNRLLLFGGLTEDGYSSELWAYSGKIWVQLPDATDGPAPRSSHDLTISGANAWLFGGIGDQGAFNDLWSFGID